MGLKITSKKWLNKLSELPESGMGYQVVDITLRDGRVICNVTVLNGDEIISKLPARERDIAQIKISSQ